MSTPVGGASPTNVPFGFCSRYTTKSGRLGRYVFSPYSCLRIFTPVAQVWSIFLHSVLSVLRSPLRASLFLCPAGSFSSPAHGARILPKNFSELVGSLLSPKNVLESFSSSAAQAAVEIAPRTRSGKRNVFAAAVKNRIAPPEVIATKKPTIAGDSTRSELQPQLDERPTPNGQSLVTTRTLNVGPDLSFRILYPVVQRQRAARKTTSGAVLVTRPAERWFFAPLIRGDASFARGGLKRNLGYRLYIRSFRQRDATAFMLPFLIGRCLDLVGSQFLGRRFRLPAREDRPACARQSGIQLWKFRMDIVVHAASCIPRRRAVCTSAHCEGSFRA